MRTKFVAGVFVCFFAGAFFFFTGCGTAPLSVAGTGLQTIAVTPAGPTLAIGAVQQFKATGTYSDGSTSDLTGSVTWFSSSTAIAAVSASGMVAAMTAGNANIMAASGGKQGYTTVTVPAPTLASIAVTPGNPTVAIGGTQQFKATGTYSDSSSKDLTGSVTWWSSNTAVATISASGLASAGGQGSSNIAASAGGITGSASLTVPAPTLQSIAVTPAAPSIAKGLTQQFKATGTYSDSSSKDLTGLVTWLSSNGAVAAISQSGLASAVGQGSSNIAASVGGITGQASLSVSAPTLQSIAVSPAAPSIAKGLTQQFKATGTYSDASTQDLTGSATWTSSKTGVATISAGGLVTAVTAGASTIAAMSGSITGQAALTVTAPTLQSLAVTPAAPSIAKGLTQQFTATGTYSDASTQDLTGSATWSSSKTGVAAISAGGLATAVTAGASTITATSGSITGQAALTVTAPTLQSIAVTPSAPTITAGNTEQFAAMGTYSDSSTQDITATATWLSSNASVATMSTITSGLAAGIAAGGSTISASSESVEGQASLTVQAAQRNYSGTASVGDFLTIAIDPNQGKLTYTNLSNNASGTVSYGVNADGSATLSDPAGHLLAVSEVPGYGIVALMNNAGSTGDQLALVTSVTQQDITAASFEGKAYNMMEFRTKGGGVGISSVAIDGSGNVAGTEFMPFNLLSGGSNNLGFNLFGPLPLPAGAPAPYLLLALPPPPDNSGNNYVFGAPNGMFLVDSEDGSMIGLPKAASPDFNSAWAGAYSLTYYQKTNANGPDGNSPEAGDVSWGVATLTLDSTGGLTLKDGRGNIMASGALSAVANTPSLYNGITTNGTTGELGDPCWGLFTFTASLDNSSQQQQVFVAFTQGALLLSSFTTAASVTPGDDYGYFYGVGLPQSSASTAANAGNSSNAGGSSTASTAGAWNSLGGTYASDPTGQRLYMASSANGDLLSIAIDPSTNTLAYYDYMNGARGSTPSTVTYTLNADGSSTVSDTSGFVLGALELPGQALFLEMNDTGLNIPSVVSPGTPVTDDPPYLVMALPQMNLTLADFAGQSYNFIGMRTQMGDETIGSMAIDAGGNFTANGFSPWEELTGSPMQPFGNLDPVTFPAGTYPAPYLATTDENQGVLFMRPDYLFGYPGSLVIYNSSNFGSFIGVPQNSVAAFQPEPGGNPITGTYQVMFYRRQVTGYDQNGNEEGPSTPWKGLGEIEGASMGFARLTVASNGTATLTDLSNNSQAWSGTLQAVSSAPALYGTGNDGKLANPCNGLYTMSLTTGNPVQDIQVFIGFVPGVQPAVVLSTFTISPNGAPSSSNYQYRYGMGFRTGN